MSLFDLKGRVALVTGGNGGIGLGMARGLAEAGAAVAIAGRNRPKSEAAAAELAGLGVKTAVLTVDVTDEAQCHRMVEDTVKELGRLDILVNNAGINIRKAAAGVCARRVAAGDRHQPHLRLLLRSGRLPGDEDGRRRQDHQHRLDDVDLRRRLCRGLRRLQGRHRAAHQGAGHRLGQGQHPGQRRAAGLDRHRPDARRARAGAGPARAWC